MRKADLLSDLHASILSEFRFHNRVNSSLKEEEWAVMRKKTLPHTIKELLFSLQRCAELKLLSGGSVRLTFP